MNLLKSLNVLSKTYRIFSQPLPPRLHLRSLMIGTKVDGYTKEQQGYILSVINKSVEQESSCSKIIAGSNGRKLREFVERNGAFDKVEDLLKVQGLGPRSLKRICDSILEENGERVANPEKKVKNSLVKLTDPILSPAQIKDLTKIVAVHLDGGAVSWALLDCRAKELLEWNCLYVAEEESKPSLMSLLETARKMRDSLPECEVYVLENCNLGGRVGCNRETGRGEGLLRAMMVALLSSGRVVPSVVVLLKARLPAQKFRTLVGSERVSYQRVVEDLFQGRLDDSHSDVLLGTQVKAAYLAERSLARESMASALLLAFTFLDTVVHPRMDLPKIRLSRSKNKQ